MSVSQKRKADRAIEERALTSLRRAATGTGTVTVRRGHLRALLAAHDRLVMRREPAEPLRIEDDTADLGCMYCVSEGACPFAESECHYPTWERRVERVGQLPLLGGAS